jgi:hypothetical protein
MRGVAERRSIDRRAYRDKLSAYLASISRRPGLNPATPDPWDAKRAAHTVSEPPRDPRHPDASLYRGRGVRVRPTAFVIRKRELAGKT